jgi:BON domain
MPKMELRNIVRFKRSALLCALSMVAIGCSGRRNNADVASDVQSRLRSDARMQMARVQVIATAGIVTLSGYVASVEQRMATVQDASQVKGVRVVIDNLRIIRPNPAAPVIESVAPAHQKPSAFVPRLADSKARSHEDEAVSDLPKPGAIVLSSNDRLPGNQTTDIHSLPSTIVSSPTNTESSDKPGVNSQQTRPSGSVLPVMVPASNIPPVQSAVERTPLAAPEQITVPDGTELVVRLTESLSTDLNEKGDTFLASLSSPVMVGDRVVIPAEAGVEGKVIEVQSAGRFSGRPRLAVEMTRLTYNGKTYDLHSNQYSKQGASRDIRSIAAIGGGAGVGAIIGGILGGGRGAAIGSIIGAGTGTGSQVATKPAPLKLPAETVLNFRLQAPLTVQPSSGLERTQRAGAGSSPDPFSSDADRPVLKRRPGSPPPETDASESSPQPTTN